MPPIISAKKSVSKDFSLTYPRIALSLHGHYTIRKKFRVGKYLSRPYPNNEEENEFCDHVSRLTFNGKTTAAKSQNSKLHVQFNQCKLAHHKAVWLLNSHAKVSFLIAAAHTLSYSVCPERNASYHVTLLSPTHSFMSSNFLIPGQANILFC